MIFLQIRLIMLASTSQNRMLSIGRRPSLAQANEDSSDSLFVIYIDRVLFCSRESGNGDKPLAEMPRRLRIHHHRLHVGAGQRTKRRGRFQREITIAQIRAASDKRGDIQGGKLGILLSMAFSRNSAVFVASSIALSSC
jgi:hypothetical protein